MPTSNESKLPVVLQRIWKHGRTIQSHNTNTANARIATYGQPVVRSAHLLRSLLRSVLSVSPQRRSEKISQRQLATGYANHTNSTNRRSEGLIVFVSIERTPCHRQTYDPEPSSSGFCCPIRLVPRHQGPQGAPARQEEGEEHQAQQVHHSR